MLGQLILISAIKCPTKRLILNRLVGWAKARQAVPINPMTTYT